MAGHEELQLQLFDQHKQHLRKVSVFLSRRRPHLRIISPIQKF